MERIARAPDKSEFSVKKDVTGFQIQHFSGVFFHRFDIFGNKSAKRFRKF